MLAVSAARHSCRSFSSLRGIVWKNVPSVRCLPMHKTTGKTAIQTHVAAAWTCWQPTQCAYASTSSTSSASERIYFGSLATRVRAVKVFSLTTSLAGLAAQPLLMEQGTKLGGTGLAVFLCGFAGFFTFVTPLLLHFITKKYVTEIHYNAETDEYTATTISFILQKVKTQFRPADVKVPEVPGMFTSFFVGKKALFVEPQLFSDAEHYARIMGFDKPLDFKLDLSEIPETPVKKDAEQKTK